MDQIFMFPLVLIGTIWGAFTSVLEAFKIILNRRNTICTLIEAPEQNADTVLKIKQQYWYTLFPLSSGLCLFLAIVATFLLVLPEFLSAAEDISATQNISANFIYNVTLVCWIAASLPVFSFFGFFWGAIHDFRKIILKK